MEPKEVQEHVFATLDFHPEPLKSSTDLSSRKSKPPDLKFIKKVTPETKTCLKNESNNIKFHRKLNNQINQNLVQQQHQTQQHGQNLNQQQKESEEESQSPRTPTFGGKQIKTTFQ